MSEACDFFYYGRICTIMRSPFQRLLRSELPNYNTIVHKSTLGGPAPGPARLIPFFEYLYQIPLSN